MTIAGPHGARLGVAVRVLSARAQLPVPVRYLMGGIAGSSGGLMFALDIYAGLRPGHARGSVAGTGTIASDGRVGPIEGVAQKLIAARRVGAELFLVPKENYASVAHETVPRGARRDRRLAKLDRRRLHVVREQFEAFAIERAHAAAVEFDGRRVLQA